MGGFLAVQSVPIPMYWGLFGGAKYPHAHILGAFWQCKVSRYPCIGGFLVVQSIPMPIYWGLFGSAKCPPADIDDVGAASPSQSMNPSVVAAATFTG